MFCPFCGKQIPKDSSFCPECGKKIGSAKHSAKQNLPTSLTLSKKQLVIGGFIIVALVVFYFVSSSLYLFNKKELKTSKETISYQKKEEVDDKLLDQVSIIKQYGENGEKEVVTEYIYDGNGRIIKTRKKSEKIIKQPKDNITLKGSASKDKVVSDVKSAANEYLNNWTNGNWKAVIGNSNNLSGYSEDELKNASEKTGYKIKSFQMNEPSIEKYGYYDLKSLKITANVPINILVSSYVYGDSTGESKLNGNYDPQIKAWKFNFFGPAKVSEVNRTSEFSLKGNSKKTGGKLAVEKIITWSGSLIFVLSGQFSDGEPIRQVIFGSVKDDLGNSSNGFLSTYGTSKTINWGGDKNLVKVARVEQLSSSYTGKPNSVSISVYSVSSDPTDSDKFIPERIYVDGLSFDGLKL